MGIREVKIYKSNIIINASSLMTTEDGAQAFEIVGYAGNASGVIEQTPSLRSTVPVRQFNDFLYMGANDVVFKNLVKGSVYYFQIRVISNYGYGSWTDLQQKVVGDNTNEITIQSNSNYPKVMMDSSGVIFKIEVDKIPLDFKNFEWTYTTQASTLTADPTKYKPSQPSYPSKDATVLRTTQFSPGLDNILVVSGNSTTISVRGLNVKSGELAGKKLTFNKNEYTISSNGATTFTDGVDSTSITVTGNFLTTPQTSDKIFISLLTSEISFTGDKTVWYHVWVRALDTSGNISPINNNNWFYCGCGKVLNYNPQNDTDNNPPDLTKTIKPSFASTKTNWIGAVN